MAAYADEYSSDLETAINISMNSLDIDIDNSIEQAIANSLLDVNINQIHNDTFTVDVLPNVFYEGSVKHHKYYGDGILLPLRMATVIADLNISDIIVLRFVIGECEYYGYISDYVDGNYAYVPGNILNDGFMPGQMVDFEIINRQACWHPATKVDLKIDSVRGTGVMPNSQPSVDMVLEFSVDSVNGINFCELLEPWIGNIYRCLIPGNIIYIEDSGKKYTIEVCNVYNRDGVCDFAIAYNTDLEIEIILPAVNEMSDSCVINKKDDEANECAKLSIAELRAHRLAYFNAK